MLLFKSSINTPIYSSHGGAALICGKARTFTQFHRGDIVYSSFIIFFPKEEVLNKCMRFKNPYSQPFSLAAFPFFSPQPCSGWCPFLIMVKLMYFAQIIKRKNFEVKNNTLSTIHLFEHFQDTITRFLFLPTALFRFNFTMKCNDVDALYKKNLRLLLAQK